ncbi:acyl-CoA dehydrogenase family protein [Bosea sp. (in: a-proteobacteria)]|uniref:acyl-CoA dehydrogenase family protein n=1 Tax=Bosea sp. (in: a-proteobacteria) TaxID=1871050 RepID=UPI002609AD45|nr:acyl-CoA dehydrogenase family protein [Bosea sp. (in: a-proteobacteria)]MCO5090222.1 acyl-CoA/acyl-ACP dehydrogenase [Bosea sp. (in: a-proteobacteria)]
MSLDIDDFIGKDYPDIRESVRKICANFPGKYWTEIEDRDEYPYDFVRELTEAGFLAALIPEQYGGSGMPLRAACAIVEEINASGCTAVAGLAQMYIMGTLLRHGSEVQKQQYLPDIAAGRLRLQAFGVTEPTTGTDTTQLKTRATRKGDTYFINGQKVFTSRALQSDLMLLLARTQPADQVRKRSDGLSVFIVDMKHALQNGMTIRKIETMISHQTTEIFFDNVPVPAENMIGEEGKGFRYILDGLNSERILVSATALGDARFFLDRAVPYAKDRNVFNRPIGQNQGVQFPLARAYIAMKAAAVMSRTAALLFDSGKNCGEEANIAKLMASEASWQAAETAMQTFGGFSYAREYDIERKWRETRLFQIGPISTNMILSYVGQHILGLPRSF